MLEALADRKGTALVWIDVRADNDVLVRRLRHRMEARDDASEAGTAVLDYQRERADPLTAAELEHTVSVATNRQVDPGAIVRSIRSMQ